MKEHVTALLSDFVDGELAAGARATVEAHLASCAACRRELEGLRGVGQLLRSLPQKPLPTGFIQRLERRAPRAEAAASPWPAPARLAAFALSSVVVGLLAYDRLKPPALPEGALPSAALSLADVDHARDIKPGRVLARAKGGPIDAPVSGFIAGNSMVASAGSGSGGASNEDLHADLERQKKVMGIRGVARKPNPLEEALKGQEAQLLAMKPEPTRIDGASPANLKQADELAAVAKAQSQARAKESDSGATGAPMAAAAPAGAQPTPSGPETYVIVTDAERQALWARLGLHLTPPSVNYQRNILALVVAPDLATAVEIVGVQTLSDKIAVRYRLFPRAEDVAGAKVAPVRAYQFRTVPKTSKQLVFELVD